MAIERMLYPTRIRPKRTSLYRSKLRRINTRPAAAGLNQQEVNPGMIILEIFKETLE